MDGNTPSVSPNDLYAHLGTAEAPLLIDVRRREAMTSINCAELYNIGSARVAARKDCRAAEIQCITASGWPDMNA
jgi:hypothetical protein